MVTNRFITMQVITVDLKKNPEIADFVADKEPGDSVCLYGTIKSLDDQSLAITVDEIEEDNEPEEKEKEPAATAADGETDSPEMMNDEEVPA